MRRKEMSYGFLKSFLFPSKIWRNLLITFQMAYLDSLSLEQLLLDGVKEWRTLRLNEIEEDEAVYEDAKDLASSLQKLKYKDV